MSMDDDKTTEWSEVSNLKSYIDKWKDFKADVEKSRTRGRRDITVYYKGNLLFTGEFKVPYVIEGRDPHDEILLEDAAKKAQIKGALFFITSNFNETVIYDNRDPNVPLHSREAFTVKSDFVIKSESDFDRPECKASLMKMIREVCYKIVALKDQPTQYKTLGQGFIEGLDSHLDNAVNVAIKYMPADWCRKYGGKYDDDDEKRRISRRSFYMFADKVFFYYVLRRSFPLLDIIIPEQIKDIKSINVIMDTAFNNAKQISGDFEVVFEKTGADEIPFLHDDLVYPMKSLLQFILYYNFSTLPQEILGNLYDKLISPEERHANGQYFTPIPVVDFINALTIKKADVRVLDPACGSGTFLTRAFELKKKLYGGKDDKELHEKIVEELYGVDIEAYPAHLATVALSSKLLYANPKIYPKIIHEDFLKVKPTEMYPRFRMAEIEHKTKTLDGREEGVVIKPIDAVVSNLPYIEQKEIQDKDAAQKAVEYALKEAGYTNPSLPDKMSDFHVYFWYYILPFLQEGSRIGFLVSDTWMNVGYGDSLKKCINRHFKILAIIDSSVERWFEDAEVNTVIVILERTKDREAKKNNRVKFVRINKPMEKLVPDIDAAVKLANEIEEGKCDAATIRTVKQENLHLDSDDKLITKLYPYLRGPDEFFILMNSDLTRLNNVADIQRGITSGANEFFYVEDVTDEYDSNKLHHDFGLRRGELRSLSIIENGVGERKIIEKEYLQPIIKSPKEYTAQGKLLFDNPPKKMVVLIEEDDINKIKHYAREYIKYGETHHGRESPERSFSERETCKARNPWWKLSPIMYPDMMIMMYFSSRFLFPRPKKQVLLDQQIRFCNMNDEYSNDLLSAYAFMNSSLSYLYPDLYGRNYGGGIVGFAVYEIEMLPIPKPKNIKKFYTKFQKALEHMEQRCIGTVFDEIWDMKSEFTFDQVKPDRLQLDRFVLQSLGIRQPDKFLATWYPKVVRIVKERLDRASSLKTKKQEKKDPSTKVAQEIVGRLGVKDFPDDYIIGRRFVELGIGQVSKGTDLEGLYVRIGAERIPVPDTKMQKYLYICALRRKTKVPRPTKEELSEALKELDDDLKLWRKRLSEELEIATVDDQMAQKLRKICSKLVGYDL